MNQFIPDLRDDRAMQALKKLTIYSVSIIVIPLVSMFFLKRYLFEWLLGYSNSDSLLYAAIIAVVMVHVVLVLFIYVAWTEEETPKFCPMDVSEKQD